MKENLIEMVLVLMIHFSIIKQPFVGAGFPRPMQFRFSLVPRSDLLFLGFTIFSMFTINTYIVAMKYVTMLLKSFETKDLFWEWEGNPLDEIELVFCPAQSCRSGRAKRNP